MAFKRKDNKREGDEVSVGEGTENIFYNKLRDAQMRCKKRKIVIIKDCSFVM